MSTDVPHSPPYSPPYGGRVAGTHRGQIADLDLDLDNSSSYVCMHLPTPVVESANFVMHASSLTYTGETPTLHAESSTIEHLDEDWQPRCTTRAVNLRTGVERTCTAPAKWFHVCGVCSLDGYSCDRCRRHAIERARCYGCMRWIADYWTWRPL